MQSGERCRERNIPSRIMKSTWSRHYDVTKRFSLLTGQWPYQRKKERILRTSVLTSAMLVMNVPQMCKFIQCDGDLECVMGAVPSYLLVLVIMLKVYMCQRKNNKIKTLTDHVIGDWESLQSPEEHEIMKTYAATARWLVLVYSAICLAGCTIFVLVSLIPQILDVVLPLNESRPVVLPFEAYYFVDERQYFFYIFFQGLVVSDIAIMGLVAHDTMFMTFVEHVCGTFAVAGLTYILAWNSGLSILHVTICRFRFEHLIYENIDVVKIVNHNLDEIYNKRMSYCVNAHWSALKFAELVESVFTVNFGIVLLLVTIGMSVTLFQITLHSDDTVEALRYALYVFAQLVHLFVFCWEGQKLIDHSLQIRDKIYNCNWYKIPTKSQRLILHVMRRTLRPNTLSASRIFIFSLQGFTTVLQTSMSYFTVLSSV